MYTHTSPLYLIFKMTSNLDISSSFTDSVFQCRMVVNFLGITLYHEQTKASLPWNKVSGSELTIENSPSHKTTPNDLIQLCRHFEKLVEFPFRYSKHLLLSTKTNTTSCIVAAYTTSTLALNGRKGRMLQQ